MRAVPRPFNVLTIPGVCPHSEIEKLAFDGIPVCELGTAERGAGNNIHHLIFLKTDEYFGMAPVLSYSGLKFEEERTMEKGLK